MSELSTGLSFTEIGLAHVLADRVLHVPLNQRPYAWEEGETRRLLDDLYSAFTDGDPIYFLGSIMLTRGSGTWELVDGQQRLATVSIIIAAVRDYLLELGDTAGANKYESSYLLDYDVRQKTSSPKLHLNYQDHDFFLKEILVRASDRSPYVGRKFQSHDLIREAATMAASHVRSITEPFPKSARADRLYDWVEFLDRAAKVILISVPGKVGNAFKMFETMNARGVEASQTDILKNFLFEKAQAKMGEIHPKWISMISTIEDLGEDTLLLTFFRHYWISERGPTTGSDLGVKIEGAIKSERQAMDLVTAMEASAIDYIALLTPRQHPRWNSLPRSRDCLYTITQELQAVQIRPLLLAIAKHFQPDEAEKAFRLCLSWSVRFLIAGGGGGGVLDRHYGLRAMEVTKKEVTTARKLAQKMIDVVPTDEVFRTAFAVATVRQGNLARYYLRALDLHLKGEAYPQFVPNEDTLAVNLEHVLPVTPGALWDIESDIAAANFRRLGNMALLGTTDNVKIGNLGFKDKRKIYKTSPFNLTAEIAKFTQWGPKEIKKQQLRMAVLAPKVWPI